ncbi:hypothetical protein FRB94_010177 [Tulasnella sp. JGI-2019a]|nr:hypothetical protein FRB94_010177 [Tulasnella sp. JGI-2019a]
MTENCEIPAFGISESLCFDPRIYKSQKAMPWQKTITLGRKSKGMHLVTPDITSQIQDGLEDISIGILHLFIQHTSAAITVNENYDPDVRKDMTMALDRIVPESLPWLHTDEGPESVSFPLSSQE